MLVKPSRRETSGASQSLEDEIQKELQELEITTGNTAFDFCSNDCANEDIDAINRTEKDSILQLFQYRNNFERSNSTRSPKDIHYGSSITTPQADRDGLNYKVKSGTVPHDGKRSFYAINNNAKILTGKNEMHQYPITSPASSDDESDGTSPPLDTYDQRTSEISRVLKSSMSECVVSPTPTKILISEKNSETFEDKELEPKDSGELWSNKDNPQNITRESLHTLSKNNILTDEMRARSQVFKEEETNSGGSASNSLQTSTPSQQLESEDDKKGEDDVKSCLTDNNEDENMHFVNFHPNRPMFDILEKSFESLLLSMQSKDTPSLQATINIIKLCFSALTVTFYDNYSSSSNDHGNEENWKKVEKVALGCTASPSGALRSNETKYSPSPDKQKFINTAASPPNSIFQESSGDVSELSLGSVKNSSTKKEKTSQISANNVRSSSKRSTTSHVWVPLEVTYLLWLELIHSVDEISAIDRDLFLSFCCRGDNCTNTSTGNTAKDSNSKEFPQNVIGKAIADILLSLGLIDIKRSNMDQDRLQNSSDLVFLPKANDVSKVAGSSSEQVYRKSNLSLSNDSYSSIRISHDINRQFGEYLSIAKFRHVSTGSSGLAKENTTSDSMLPLHRWNSLLVRAFLSKMKLDPKNAGCFLTDELVPSVNNSPNYSCMSNSDTVATPTFEYVHKDLPAHMILCSSHDLIEVCGSMLKNEQFCRTRLRIMGSLRGTLRHRQDCLLLQRKTKMIENGIDNCSEPLVFNDDMIMKAYEKISKCLLTLVSPPFDEGNDESVHKPNNNNEVITSTPIVNSNPAAAKGVTEEVGHAMHALGVFYSSIIDDKGSIIKNRNLTGRKKVIYDAEMKHFEQALKLKRQTLGKDHESVADTLLCIGLAHYSVAEDSYRAMTYINQALEIYRNRLGEDDLNVAKTLHNSAIIYCESGDFTTAMECLREALRVRKLVLGDTNHEDISENVLWIGKVYRELGDYALATKHFKAALWAKEARFGKCHLEVAEAYHNLGVIFGDREQYDRAAKCFSTALSIRRSKLGSECEDVVSSLYFLAGAYRDMGRDADALDLFNEALHSLEALLKSSKTRSNDCKVLIPLYEEVISLTKDQKGEGSQELATLLQSLGYAYDKADRRQLAIDAYTDALRIRKLKMDHWNIGTILNTLGILHAKTNQYGKALKCFQEAIIGRKLRHGPDDLEVANTLHNMGNAYAKLNKLGKAMDAYDGALRVRKMQLGDHVSVAKTMHNIGNIHRRQRSYDEALNCYSDALRIRELKLGLDHLDVAYTLENIGMIYSESSNKLEDPEKALAHLERVLLIRKHHLPNDDVLVADALFLIGSVYESTGNDSKAIKCLDEALWIYKLKLGDSNLNVAKVLDMLGTIYEGQCNYETASRHYGNALEIKQKFSNEEDVSEAFLSLGSVQEKMGEDDGALSCYKRALKLKKKLYGKTDSTVATILNDVGIIQARRKQLDIALKCLNESLRLRQLLNGFSHAECADTLYNIGNVHQGMGASKEAIMNYEKACGIYKEVFSSDHLDVAGCFCGTGDCFAMLKQYSKALRAYEQALDIRRIKLGNDHLEVASVLHSMAVICNRTGTLKKAMECSSECLRVRRLHHGPEHCDIAESLHSKGLAHEAMSEWKLALGCFQEAGQIWTRHFANDSSLVANALNKEGEIHEVLGSLGEALECFVEALRVRRQQLPDDNEFVGETLFNIASIQYKRKEYDTAMMNLEEALRIFILNYGHEHKDVAKVFNRIGQTRGAQEHFSEALKNHNEAVTILKTVLGPNDISVASTFDNIGAVYQAKQQYTHAIQCLQESLRIKKTIKINSTEVGDTYFSLGVVNCEAGELEEALNSYDAALNIRRQKLGRNSVAVAQTLHNIGSVFALKKNYDEALTRWKCAVAIYKETGLDESDMLVACTSGNINVAEAILLESEIL